MRETKTTVRPKSRKHRRAVHPNLWLKHAEERDRRIEEREARKDRFFEELSATMSALVDSLKPKDENRSLPPGTVETPSYTCLIMVDKTTVATITDVPNLGPVLEMFMGFCARNTAAKNIALELILDNDPANLR